MARVAQNVPVSCGPTSAKCRETRLSVVAWAVLEPNACRARASSCFSARWLSEPRRARAARKPVRSTLSLSLPATALPLRRRRGGRPAARVRGARRPAPSRAPRRRERRRPPRRRARAAPAPRVPVEADRAVSEVQAGERRRTAARVTVAAGQRALAARRVSAEAVALGEVDRPTRAFRTAVATSRSTVMRPPTSRKSPTRAAIAPATDPASGGEPTSRPSLE
jgi:hypothetical protein